MFGQRTVFLVIRRSLRCSHTNGRRWNSHASIDPLRILFCGSDEFSVVSLTALHAEQLRAPQSIKAIEVVCRPDKRVDRGLKNIRQVPIKTTATNLGLKIHELDTFKGWSPPDGPFDLIIAVSFGLFIPSRLLSAAKYGGVNVHPSLLPDLRGPAPLHHTLISGRTTTGVTLQTLHHKHFDQGLILDQSPAPGISVPNPDSCTVPELLDFLAPKGADMLVNGIRNRIFVPPLREVGSQDAEHGLTHAAKITPKDRHIDWQNWTWAQISRRQRVLNPLWNTALAPTKQKTDNSDTPKLKPKRILFDDLEPVPRETVPGSEDLKLLPGVPFVPSKHKSLFVYTADGQLLRLGRLKVEGDRFNDALIAAQKARMFSPNAVRFSDVEFSLFHNPLC